MSNTESTGKAPADAAEQTVIIEEAPQQGRGTPGPVAAPAQERPPTRVGGRGRRNSATSRDTPSRTGSRARARQQESRRPGLTESEAFVLMAEKAELEVRLEKAQEQLAVEQDARDGWKRTAHEENAQNKALTKQRDGAIAELTTLREELRKATTDPGRPCTGCTATRASREKALTEAQRLRAELAVSKAEEERLQLARDTAHEATTEANERAAQERARAEKAERRANGLQRDLDAANKAADELARQLRDAEARAVAAERRAEDAEGKTNSLSAVFGSDVRPEGSTGAAEQSPRQRPPQAADTAFQTATDIGTRELEERVADLEEQLRGTAADHQKAEQELEEVLQECARDHIEARNVFVRVMPLENAGQREAWRQQMARATRWARRQLGAEQAADLVAEAVRDLIGHRFAPSEPATFEADQEQVDEQVGEQEQQRQTATLFGRAAQQAAPSPTTAVTREQVEGLERVAARIADAMQQQQQQPQQSDPATTRQAQTVIMKTPTVPPFNKEAARTWLATVEATTAHWPDDQAALAISKALGQEAWHLVDVFGRTPKTRADWIAAINAVYPPPDTRTVEDRFKTLEQNRGTETLEAFVQRAIRFARGTSWTERQVVDEISRICHHDDAVYLRRTPPPSTTMELLERARKRDNELCVGRDPPRRIPTKPTNKAGKAGGGPVGTKANPTIATTSYADAAATGEKQGAPSGSAESRAGQAGNKPKAQGNQPVTQDQLASAIKELQTTLMAALGGKSPRGQQQQRQQSPDHGATSRIKCYGCNERGHIRAQCPNKAATTRPAAATVAAGTVRCQLCEGKGHSANKCPAFADMLANNGEQGN